MDTNVWRFLSCCLAGERLENLFCAVEFIDDRDAGKANSTFCVHHADEWFGYQTEAQWSASAMTSTIDSIDGRALVIAVSATGDLWELRPKGPEERTGLIGGQTGLTSLATIQQQVFACGMGRRCLRRSSLDVWEDISAPWPSPHEGVIGFTCMAGDASGRLHAAGWGGEVWSRDDERWRRWDSPTNANLNALAFGADGALYCAGDHGVLLRFRGDQSEVLETGTDQDLYSLRLHNDTMFVCSLSEIFRVSEGGLLRDIAEGQDAPRTCLHLLSDNREFLYSVGPSDVFRRSRDGWERLA